MTLWVEKYRPKTVAETILPSKLKSELLEMLKSGEIPHSIFHGKSGIGKTTVARAIAHGLGMDFIFINGSDDRNIDTLRTKVKQFASSISLTPGLKKLVIIDEADYLNSNSTQPALRAFIEEFEDNCRFIFTCNFEAKLLPAIRSRCQLFNFMVPADELQVIQLGFYNRLNEILKAENVEADPKTLAEVVFKFSPDWRKVIGECQRYSVTGKIDAGIFVDNVETNIKKLLECISKKDFKGARAWIGENSSIETTSFYRALFDNLGVLYINDDARIQAAILIIGDYSYKSAFVIDQEVNMSCCIVELLRV